MRKIKIVADSSANILKLNDKDIEFSSAPLKIITAEKEFTDDSSLNVDGMVNYFDEYKGRSKTSCPSPSDWLEAFGDAEDIFCIAITSGLSGSYNSACVAKDIYETEHKDRRVYVMDSLTAGPEMELIVEKFREFIKKGMSYEEICTSIQKYKNKTGLIFMLESLKNFAANGRISPTVAKITGFLGIRIIGQASEKGDLELLNKSRGEARSLETIFSHLKEMGLSKGKVRIAHCSNYPAAQRLKEVILQALPKVDVAISECRGLCSYYAVKGGLLVGFEKM